MAAELPPSSPAPPAPPPPEPKPAGGRERRLRYPLLWLAFVLCMFAGAGLLLSQSPALRYAGLGLILLPLVLLFGLSLAYYLVERFKAQAPRP